MDQRPEAWISKQRCEWEGVKLAGTLQSTTTAADMEEVGEATGEGQMAEVRG